MSNASQPASRRSVRRNRSIYQVHYGIKRREDMPKPYALPTNSLEIQAYGMQVAGHRKSEDTRYLGLLQCNDGTILKPIIKESQKREVDFYTRVSTSEDPVLVELRSCVAKYHGCKKYAYNGHEQDYIILEDLSAGMLEPCIMDVKIGRQTWDPLASEEKKKREQSKYAACKQQFAFCIPGFQLHKLGSGKLHTYCKDYGKKLRGQAVVDAIRIYLNGSHTTLCRALLLQLLSGLWKVQKWARRQTAVRLHSTSLLLLYDAAKLRECCGETDELTSNTKCKSPLLPQRRSSISLQSAGSNFSGQLSPQGPVYHRVNSVPITPLSLTNSTFSPPPPIHSPWSEALERLNQNHSFEHNYENKLSKIKMSYRAILDQLASDSPASRPWASVKVIDFAHAFFNEEEEKSLDDNFREGIDNFVEIIESFLRETDDQL